MASTCVQMSGFLLSCFGWIGIIIATATSEWVVTCRFDITTCKKMDELGTRGLWEDCVLSTDLYHCRSLTDILLLPAYIQTSRALMISASILGLPAILLVMMSLPCINLGSEPESIKYKRSVVGGVLILLIAICSIIPTVWFPIASHRESGLVTFGYSLYAGWIGAALCLFGGSMISCCSGDSPEYSENRYYYSKHRAALSASPNHAKNAHV
ncbi:claudin-11-like [Acipenser ruthenus]|uniref:claudin-11-like n=1 Tax=Acipenser ruthenus TaxID=7906 RepID=UPI002740AA3C|nr:claudin-11-like [Acipenser ruthenus]